MATLKPTTPLLAPNKGNSETGITSAPENCTKNDHFSPAKATAVSDKAQPMARAKVLAVSGETATAHEHQAPPV